MALRIHLLLLFFGLLFAIESSAQQSPDDPSLKPAKQFIEYLIQGKYTSALSLCSGRLKAELRDKQLGELWEQLEGQYGPYESRGKQFVVSRKEHQILYATINFKKASLFLKLVLDTTHHVAGIFLEPAPKEGAYKTPSYVDYNRIKELRTTLINAHLEMPARLTVPKTQGPHPVVVLVHGSGPQDMDESTGVNKPFRDLALGLATNGVAVFRYDKRTRFMAPEDMAHLTIHDEVTNDALAAIELLKTFPEIDSNRIFILGHSLGGMMAPEIAKRAKDLSGVVLFAAPSRSLQDVLIIQLNNLKEKAANTGDTAELVGLEELLKKVENTHPSCLTPTTPSEKLPFNIPAPYWESLNAYDQGKVAKQLQMPIYVMHAKKDVQVFEEDFALWQLLLKGKSNVRFKKFEGLNHAFMKSHFDEAEKDYEVEGNVDGEVISTLVSWVLEAE
jgi:dienelactone hydrolase